MNTNAPGGLNPSERPDRTDTSSHLVRSGRIGLLPTGPDLRIPPSTTSAPRGVAYSALASDYLRTTFATLSGWLFGMSHHRTDNRVGRPPLSYQTRPGVRLSQMRAMGQLDPKTVNPDALKREYGPSPWWSEDHLAELLHYHGLSADQIAEVWNVTAETIRDRAREYGIGGAR